MKKYVFILTCCLSYLSFAQNQANWWFFGQNAGIEFTPSGPRARAGELITDEGCSAIADACGNLLFYSDGTNVWNASGVIMPNGSGLLGDPSSTQSAFIIALPQNDRFYYLFTASTSTNQAIPDGLNYSVIDMTLDSGQGDVVAGQKNIELLQDATEKITAVKHANGTDAWLITYGESVNGSDNWNRFIAFRLTPSGIDTSGTVFSGSPTTRTTERRGYLKSSPDGTRLAMMNQGIVTVNDPDELGVGAFLFDFDNATGRVNNPERLNFPPNYHAYGGEFSPNNELFYLDLNTQQGGILAADRLLLQYNLNAPNFTDNPFTVYETNLLDSTDDITRGALQIAPDKKIYYARDQSQWLSVINDPNNLGAACNFQYDGMQLAGNTLSTEGLPPFYETTFEPSFTFVEGCVGTASMFFADSIAQCPDASISWNFGDPSSGVNNNSTQSQVDHIYANSGTYTVTLDITTTAGNYSATRDIVIVNTPTIFPIDDLSACDQLNPFNDGVESINFTALKNQALGNQSASLYEASIHASLSDAELDINDLSSQAEVSTGVYFVRIDRRDSNGCFIIEPFNITIVRDYTNNVLPEFIQCDGLERDGVELFDLTGHILSNLPQLEAANYDFKHFPTRLDAQNNTREFAALHPNNLPREEIFTRVTFRANPACSSILSFFIELSAQPSIPFIESINACDDPSNDGVVTYDLNAIRDLITDLHSPVIRISFHEDEQSAIDRRNSVALNYSPPAGVNSIWIRGENTENLDCVDIVEVDLVVFPFPELTISENITKCPDDSVRIEATAGFVSYLWNTGATTSFIETTEEGDYEVTIIDENGCSATATTSVRNYQETRIENIEVEQFRINDNTILVEVSGEGPWIYSLDGVSYQESPLFTNLLPGYYTIYVRDIRSCATVEGEATVVAAPPFFTPNDDSYNDTWQVTAIETLPDAQIYIFDRYGKLLKQLDPLGPGWDGNFNDNPMPSSDYWYRVQLTDGRSFRGHFTLKR